MPQYMMRTNKVEHAKRNGMVTIELANTKGRAPYRPFAVSFSKLARSSRTALCGISSLNVQVFRASTHIREYRLLTLIYSEPFSTNNAIGAHVRVKPTKSKERHRIEMYGEPIVDGAGVIAQSDPYSSEHHAHSYRVDGRFSIDVKQRSKCQLSDIAYRHTWRHGFRRPVDCCETPASISRTLSKAG
jgi:hypothetical protein